MKLFFLDYNKEGPGVDKDAPTKEGLELFLDIFAREFTSLIKLNIYFLLSCIPIITIGPAIGALTSVTMRMVQDKPSDIFYDFREAFKRNWKYSFISWIIAAIFMSAIWFSIKFCMESDGIIYNFMISFIIVIAVLFGILFIYVYPMIVKIELPLKVIFRNSFLLGIVNIKYSLITFLLNIGLIEISIIFMPFTLPVMLLFTFSITSFINSFCAWNGLEKYIIKEHEN